MIPIEFVAAKFNQNLAFVQLFIGSYSLKIRIYIVYINRLIGLVGRVFANGPGDQVASYQRLLKWNLIPPCLTLSNIRYVSRVKWSKSGKEVVTSPTPRCSSH